MTAGRVYADATALIGLARIDRLDLLSLLPLPVLVTEVVWRECAGDSTKPGVTALLGALDAGLLSIVGEGSLLLTPELDGGESTVLTAAATAGAAVLIDERKARAMVASRPGLKDRIPHAFGLIGLLLLAKREARVRAVAPLLEALVAQGFWMSPECRVRVLAQAGEV